MEAPGLTGEDLDAHGAWMRGLAYAILKDHALAEDVSQEVFERALEGGLRERGRLKAWLAAMTRNASRNRLRERRRRAAREGRAARPEKQDPEQTNLEVLEAHQEVVRALRAVAPRHRELLMKRFHDDLTIAQIAAGRAATEATVRKQMHRALAAVRAELNRRPGGSDQYCGVVLGPTLAAEAMRQHALRRISMTPILSVMGLAIVAGVGVFLQNSEPAETLLDRGERAALTGRTENQNGSTQRSEAAGTVRSEVAEQSADARPRDGIDLELSRTRLCGIVVDDGRPVDAATVYVETDGELVTAETGADGTFVLEADPSRFPIIWAVKGDRVGIPPSPGFGGPEWPMRIQMKAADASHRIQIFDAVTEEPLVGAELEFRAWRGDATLKKWRDREVVATLQTDAQGSVLLDGELAARRLLVAVHAAGHYSLITVTNPRLDPVERRILLARAAADRPRILNSQGEPIAGLRVVQWTGSTALEAVTNASGEVEGPLLGIFEDKPLFWIQDAQGLWIEDTALERRGVDGVDRILPELHAVEVRVVEGRLAAGTWLEATNRSGQLWGVRMTDGPMEPVRVNLDRPTPLRGSFAAESRAHNQVALQLQPHGQFLEPVQVENGIAVVRIPDSPWVRFRIRAEAGSVEAEGWELFLQPEVPTSGASGLRRGTVKDGVVELAVPAGRWFVRLSPPPVERIARTSRWAGIQLQWDGSVLRPLSGRAGRLEVSADGGEIVLPVQIPRLERAQVFLAGRPVMDGMLRVAEMSHWIDFDGGCELAIVDGKAGAVHSVTHRSGRGGWDAWGAPPIPDFLRLEWADPIPWKRGGGDADWRLEIPLAEVEIPGGTAMASGLLEYQGQSPSGSWASDWMRAATVENPELRTALRLPPGRYRFRMGEQQLTPPEGVSVTDGLLTVLQTWVPLEEEGGDDRD